MAQAERLKGVVKWFSGQKGFGFITPDNGSEDLFVHQKSIRSQGFRTLLEGEVVEFAIGRSEDGRTKAVDVSGPNGSYVSGGNGGRGSGGGDRGISTGFGRRIVSYDSYERGYGSYGRSHGRGGGMGGGYGRSGTGTGNVTTTGGGCYNCGRTGHMARDCYQGTEGSGGGGGGRSSSVSSRGGGYYAGGRGCYNCGEKGHLARECPNYYQQE